MLLSRCEAMLFDLDGTLVTLPVDWEAVRRDLREYFRTTDPFLPLFKTIEAKTAKKPEDRSAVFSLIDKYEVAATTGSQLLPGVLDVFTLLYGRRRLALVTMQGRRVCSKLLEMHGLTRFFEFSVTREDSLDRPVQLEISMKRLSTNTRNTLFIGDRANDVNSARRVGLPVVLVSGGKVENSNADLRFDTMIAFRNYLSDPGG